MVSCLGDLHNHGISSLLFCVASGSVVGPEKMQHILDKNQDMYNAFIKAIEELRILQKNLINTEVSIGNEIIYSNEY